jgi:hypothetical protein
VYVVTLKSCVKLHHILTSKLKDKIFHLQLNVTSCSTRFYHLKNELTIEL